MLKFLKTVFHVTLFAILMYLAYILGIESGQQSSCEQLGGLYVEGACFHFEEFIPGKG